MRRWLPSRRHAQRHDKSRMRPRSTPRPRLPTPVPDASWPHAPPPASTSASAHRSQGRTLNASGCSSPPSWRWRSTIRPPPYCNFRAPLELLRPGPAIPPADELVRYAFPLALAHLQQGDSVEAAELFERIVESGAQRLHYPWEYVRSFYFLGKIAEEDGDTNAARRYYQRFLEYWGDGDIDTDRVEEARAFIGGS